MVTRQSQERQASNFLSKTLAVTLFHLYPTRPTFAPTRGSIPGLQLRRRVLKAGLVRGDETRLGSLKIVLSTWLVEQRKTRSFNSSPR